MHAATTNAAKLKPNAATPTSNPRPALIEEIGGATEPDVTAASQEAVDAELEAEEEQEEDQPDLGDEVGHLGRLHEADEARVVRPEDDPGEEVRGDRGQPEPARDEPENAEQRDGDGKLGERHRRPFFPRAGHFACGEVPRRAAYASRRRCLALVGLADERSPQPILDAGLEDRDHLVAGPDDRLSPRELGDAVSGHRDELRASSGSEIPATRFPAAGASAGTCSSTISSPSLPQLEEPHHAVLRHLVLDEAEQPRGGADGLGDPEQVEVLLVPGVVDARDHLRDPVALLARSAR